MIRVPILALLFVGFAATAHEDGSPNSGWYRALSRPDHHSDSLYPGKIVCCGPKDCIPTVYHMVPIKTAAAPTINTTLEMANSLSAKDEEISHINSLTVIGFAAVCVLSLFAILAAIWRAAKLWRR